MTWGSSPLVPIQTGLISPFKGEEKSLHHVALVAMVSGSQQTVVLQIWQKIWHVWLSSAWLHLNGRPCQERLLWSRNFATMVTWRHTSLFCHDGLRGLNPTTWDLRSYKTLSGGSVKKIFSWNKTMCDYLLTFHLFWYGCLHGISLSQLFTSSVVKDLKMAMLHFKVMLSLSSTSFFPPQT